MHATHPSEQALQVLAVASKKKPAMHELQVLSSEHVLQFAIFPAHPSQIPIAVLLTFYKL